MSAIGWITAAHRSVIATVFRRARARKPGGRKLTPGLESLESIDLLSAGLVSALGTPIAASAYTTTISTKVDTTATQSTVLQTASVPSTLTNFTAPFAPTISLFNPNLGTLVAVDVTVEAQLTSQIKSQNTSTTSAADITPFINGNYTVGGLSEVVSNTLTIKPTPTPVAVSVYNGTDAPFTGTSTVLWTSPPYNATVPVDQTFPPEVASDNEAYTLTAAGDLAFYTASTGRTTLTPNLTENGQSGATAPNGNLQTDVVTAGSGVITVSYEYIPRTPNVVSLVRYGIHHQPTQLQLTFDGPIIPASEASDPANYTVVVPNSQGSFTGPGISYVAVKSAVYDEANNTVTLVTARRLNFHKLFQLKIDLPSNNGNIITIEFGGPKSLGGFTNPHAGNVFVPVVDGKPVKNV